MTLDRLLHAALPYLVALLALGAGACLVSMWRAIRRYEALGNWRRQRDAHIRERITR